MSGLARTEVRMERLAMALNLELSHGRPGASARVEFHDRSGGRVAVLSLRGWIDAIAVKRLTETLADLEKPEIAQLLLDCSAVRHVDYRQLPALVAALARFESRAAGLVVCGLSPYLRDLFRLAGCERRLRCWPSAQELLETPADDEPSRERAS